MQAGKVKLVDQIMTALQKVIDPELQVDIVNLGLIYGINLDGPKATVKMTLTISGCPLSSYLQEQIQKAVLTVSEIESCQVQLVWYPVWSPARMTVAAKRQLGMLKEKKPIREKQKVLDFKLPIKQLADQYPDFVQIMYDCGFTRIKIPGLLKTVGRVMTVPLGAQAMKLDLKKIKQAFIDQGYKVVE